MFFIVHFVLNDFQQKCELFLGIFRSRAYELIYFKSRTKTTSETAYSNPVCREIATVGEFYTPDLP